MRKLFTERTAVYCLLCILASIIVFHLLVLVGVIPFQIVWGGRLTDRAQMVQFESISIVVNLIMLAIVTVRAGLLKLRINPIIITIALWVMCVLFLLNTVGNLLSTNAFEKAVFTPLTLLLSVCCFRLAISKGWKTVSN
jgi:hypothetical protein